MTHATALSVSRELVQLGFPHTIEVGVYDHLAQRVQARVDLRFPRRFSGGLGEAINQLETVAAKHDLELGTSMIGEGLTFSTREERPQLPGDARG